MSHKLSLVSTWLPLNKDGEKLGNAGIFIRKTRIILG